MPNVNKYLDTIKEWFYLDEDGVVRRAKDGYKGRYKKGDIVKPFKLCSHGYGGVHIPRTRTTVAYHHLITVLRGIDIPDGAVVDHINGNPDDNSIENIRIVTQSVNCRNTRRRSNNTSGVNGINKTKHGFVVRRFINGKRKYFGIRKTLEEAIELLESHSEEIKAAGYTERHGK